MQINASSISFGVLLLAVLGVASCGARPHLTDNAFGDLQNGDTGAMDNSLVPRVESNHMLSPEDSAIASIQMQLLQQYANNLRMGSSPWDQLFRAPLDKRQVRYRQCYFNPISCFRK